MNPFNSAKNAFARWTAKQVLPLLPKSDLASVLTGLSYPGEDLNVWPDYSYDEFEKLAAVSPVVKSDIDLIGKSIMDSDVEVQERDTKNKEEWIAVEDHPFERLLNVQPFTDMGGAYAKWHQAMWLMLRGEAYWMLVPDGFKQLKYIVPIPAFMIKPISWKRSHGGEPRMISFFAYAPNDPRYPQRLDCEHVCFHRLPNPWNPIRGLSPISSFRTQLQTHSEAEKFDLDDYRHGLTLSKIISLRPDIQNREFFTAKADWLNAVNERSRFRVIRGGDVDVKDLSTRRGEEGQNVHRRAERYADRNWGIPEGLRDMNATEASAKVAEGVYESRTVTPLLKLMAQDYTSQILWRYYGEDIRAYFESTVPTDKREELEERDSDREVQTYDEARSLLGLKPHPDKEIGSSPAKWAGRVYEAKIKAVHGMGVSGTGGTDNRGRPRTRRFEDDEKAIKQAERFIPLGEFNPLDESEAEISARLQSELEDIQADFDERQPDYAGILATNGRGE